MSALVSAELLKLRTVRSFWAYLLAVVAFAAVGTAGTIGSATSEAREGETFVHDLTTVAGVAGLVALVLGIVLVTNEFRHGTVTPTFLVTPRRERVLSAKLVAGLLGGLGLALVAVLVVLAVSVVWLTIIDASPPVDGDAYETMGRAVLQAVLMALLGVAVGAAVHAQVAALVGTLLWFLLVEPLFGALLGVIELDALEPYLPNQAISAVLEGEGSDALSFVPAVLVSLAWIAAIAAFGFLRTARTDVT